MSCRLLLTGCDSAVLSNLRDDARFLFGGPRVSSTRTLELSGRRQGKTAAAQREYAVSYFGPMADHLESGDDRVLVLPAWDAGRLPVAYHRMLARTALALGALHLGERVQARPEDSTCYELLRPGGLLDGSPRVSVGGVRVVAGNPLASTWYELVRAAGETGGPGAGRYAPGGVLLVGERPHVAKTGELKHRLPFVTFDYSGCAAWFAEQLEQRGLSEQELYWINAYDAHGAVTDPDFIKELQPRSIWALGKLAAQWCNDFRLPHYDLPHPQYWKRFHYNRRYPFP